MSEGEIVFQFFFFGKQPKKNKLYFYLTFSLTGFFFFLCYQTLENAEKCLYKNFSSKTNKA